MHVEYNLLAWTHHQISNQENLDAEDIHNTLLDNDSRYDYSSPTNPHNVIFIPDNIPHHFHCQPSHPLSCRTYSAYLHNSVS